MATQHLDAAADRELSELVACTLNDTSLKTQRERWINLGENFGIARHEVADGLRLTFKDHPAVAAELEAPERISGRRRYPAAVLRTLAVIETAQRAGLSLDEIRLLLRATPGDRAATEQLRDVAEKKLPVLREAIERAEIVRRWLEDAARCCCPTLDDCPLFEDPVRLPERSLVLL